MIATLLVILGAGAIYMFSRMVGDFVNLMYNSKKEKR